MRLGVITLGHVHAEELSALTPHLQHLEQLVLDVPFDDPLSKHRAELNRAVDAATDDWLLIVRDSLVMVSVRPDKRLRPRRRRRPEGMTHALHDPRRPSRESALEW